MATPEFDKIGVGVLESANLNEDIRFAQYAEELGYDSVWHAESRLVREGFSILGAIAQVTHEIELGTGILPMWTRNVALMAQGWATLEEIAGPRCRAGLGAWWDPLAERVGIDRQSPNPLRAMWEYCEALRQLLDLETVTYDGDYVQLDEVKLDLIRAEVEKHDIPLYIGATGLQMNKMTGELCGKGVLGGVVLNAFLPVEYVEDCVDSLEEGAEKQGGSLDDVDRPEYLAVSMDEDYDVALDKAKGITTQYIGQQQHITNMCDYMGYSDLPDTVDEELGGWPATVEEVEQAKEVVPDEVVERMVNVGTPDTIADRVQEYVDAGATEPVLYPVSKNPREIIEVFADHMAE
jgi:alkanesulfonate monooxygenase SsuD/methylene tetrahydromethanopterin reductase-like flavin-dependent oxidoreductase (luciferase family)